MNVVAGIISLYSVYLASVPRDENHPYGHGKAEFVSAAVEGSLISVAGLIIIYESIKNYIQPKTIQQLDAGILLIASTAIVNFVTGYYALQTGKKNNSLALIASGKHLQTDTWSTVAIVGGLVLIYFTGWTWVDNIVAVLFSFFIIYTGYTIIRSSLAGIMDESDTILLEKLVATLNSNRTENWIDLHNLRIIKFGNILHVDCHLTVPWYLNVNEAHHEVDLLSDLVRKEFGETVELFVHNDGCLEFSCKICSKHDCQVRQHDLVKKIDWTIGNVSTNIKHSVITDKKSI